MNYPPLVSEHSKKLIKELFDSSSHKISQDSSSLAMEWLKKHDNKFSGFINGSWIVEKETDRLQYVCNPFNQELLANVFLPSEDNLSTAHKSCLEALNKWETLSAYYKAKHLYNIANSIHKHSHLFALVEALSTGKHLTFTKKEISNLIHSFYYNAGNTFKQEKGKNQESNGVICVITDVFNSPSLSISLRVSSLLAAGSTVLILADAQSCFSSFLLAEICNEAGLPPGVINVLPFSNKPELVKLPFLSKIMLSGSPKRCREIISNYVMCYEECNAYVFNRPTMIIYENADLNSASKSALEIFHYYHTRSESSGCLLLVQANIINKFLNQLKPLFEKISIGPNFTKTDMSSIVTEEQLEKLNLFINEAKEQSAQVLQVPKLEANYLCFSPTLLSFVATNSKIVTEEIGGPVLVIVPFSTVKESIAICNWVKNLSDVSIWTEKISLILEVISKLKARNIWINTENKFDATMENCGMQLDDCNNEVILKYSCPKLPTTSEIELNLQFGIHPKSIKNTFYCNGNSNIKDQDVYETYNLFIGGTYRKSSGNISRLIFDYENKPFAYVSEGTSSDIHSAILSARAAQLKWEDKSAFDRSQILFLMADNLRKRKNEFAIDIQRLTNNSLINSQEEIEAAIEKLFFWATQTNKFTGSLKEAVFPGQIIQSYYSLGVIGIICPNEAPLISFISLVAPAISQGNSVVVILSEKFPFPALKMCQVFDSSHFPGGIINVLTGCQDYLIHHLCQHMDIKAVWFPETLSQEGKLFVRYFMNISFNRSWCYTIKHLQENACYHDNELVLRSTKTKTSYFPKGEIFAN